MGTGLHEQQLLSGQGRCSSHDFVALRHGALFQGAGSNTKRLGDSYPERSLRGLPASSFSYLAKIYKMFYSQTSRKLQQCCKGNKENFRASATLLVSKHPSLKTKEDCRAQRYLQQTSQARETNS